MTDCKTQQEQQKLHCHWFQLGQPNKSEEPNAALSSSTPQRERKTEKGTKHPFGDLKGLNPHSIPPLVPRFFRKVFLLTLTLTTFDNTSSQKQNSFFLNCFLRNTQPTLFLWRPFMRRIAVHVPPCNQLRRRRLSSVTCCSTWHYRRLRHRSVSLQLRCPWNLNQIRIRLPFTPSSRKTTVRSFSF